jgi:hypothetical protein
MGMTDLVFLEHKALNSREPYYVMENLASDAIRGNYLDIIKQAGVGAFNYNGNLNDLVGGSAKAGFFTVFSAVHRTVLANVLEVNDIVEYKPPTEDHQGGGSSLGLAYMTKSLSGNNKKTAQSQKSVAANASALGKAEISQKIPAKYKGIVINTGLRVSLTNALVVMMKNLWAKDLGHFIWIDIMA